MFIKNAECVLDIRSWIIVSTSSLEINFDVIAFLQVGVGMLT